MAFDIILFGGKGDLSWRKLMPALFQAHRHGALPSDGRILAVSRDETDTLHYQQWLEDKFKQLSWDEDYTEIQFTAFLQCIEYLSLDLTETAHYHRVADWVATGTAESVTLYLATTPQLFTGICEGLAKVGLNHASVRVVLEKPLGHDLESARAINKAVSGCFAENQIFRIDHYLGKQSVQNLLALRFGNCLFEPLWRREAVQNVQITIAEDLGVEQRGGYYDQSGALRDMVQNHLLQLLCIVAMEPPASDDADAIRDEKLKVLRSLRVYKDHEVNQYVVRGQYREGIIEGVKVPGYLDESGVPNNSNTETYVAIRAEIDNWRWAGVPFFLRTGKRLAKKSAEIVINFKAVPHSIFGMPMQPANNRLVISLQPEDKIELQLFAKISNREQLDSNRLTAVNLDLNFKDAYGNQTIDAYERLLLMVIAGRLDLFVRFDEQQAAWNWVMPILNAWENNTTAPRSYVAGTWGPPAASALVARDNASWAEES